MSNNDVSCDVSRVVTWRHIYTLFINWPLVLGLRIVFLLQKFVQDDLCQGNNVTVGIVSLFTQRDFEQTDGQVYSVGRHVPSNTNQFKWLMINFWWEGSWCDERCVCGVPVGVTALHLAVQRGNADAVRCLLSAGVDVNVVDKCGRTALFYALTRNDVAVTQLLMSFGAISTTSAATQAVYSSKCSTDILQLIQPAMSYRQLPACCPTGQCTVHLCYLLTLFVIAV